MSETGEADETIRMIRDSARAIAPESDLSRVRACRFSESGFDRAMLTRMAEMGWLALRLDEEAGGLGLGMREYVALAETLGAGLVPEPLFGVVMALRLAPDLYEEAASGKKIVLAAWQDAPQSLEWRNGVTQKAGRVSGAKLFVQGASGAERFVVPFAGGVAIVDGQADGLRLERQKTQDGGHFATLILDDVAADIRGEADTELGIEEAALAHAAYLHGLTERAFTMTIDYLKIRRQFDRPIGSFQALQHRATDMKIQIALARAALDAAASRFDAGPFDDVLRAAASQAKARIADTAVLVAREAIQMHGAIGFTDEFDVGLHVRKAMTLCNLFGGAAFHRARYDRLMPERDAA